MFSRFFSRVGLLAAPFLAIIMVGCSRAEMTVRQSTLDPKGPVAQVQYDLFMQTVWLVVVLFVLVGGLLVYAVIKFRARPGDENKPAIVEDGHGNPLIEIGLITASIGSLVIIAIPTLTAIWYTDDVPAESVPTSKLSVWYPRVEGTRENYAKSVEEEVLVVDVIGKQWWFRFEYPQLGLTNDAKRSVPNELVIPKGVAVRINLRSEDVIHSFWVPKLAGKVDLMPGRKNHMWLQASETGHYYGQCAEFCGDSHAYMLFRVEVLEPAEFAKWVQKQKADAAPVAAGSKAEKGKAVERVLELENYSVTSVGDGAAALEALTRIDHPWWKTHSRALQATVQKGIEGLAGQEREHDAHGQLPHTVPTDQLDAQVQQRIAKGMDEWAAFQDACRALGGTVVEAGPETACQRRSSKR